jgi:hypothetical protein
MVCVVVRNIGLLFVVSAHVGCVNSLFAVQCTSQKCCGAHVRSPWLSRHLWPPIQDTCIADKEDDGSADCHMPLPAVLSVATSALATPMPAAPSIIAQTSTDGMAPPNPSTAAADAPTASSPTIKCPCIAGTDNDGAVDGHLPFSAVLAVATSALTAPLPATRVMGTPMPLLTVGSQASTQAIATPHPSTAAADASAVAGALQPLAWHCMAAGQPWGVRLEALRSVKALLECATAYGELGLRVQAAAVELLQRLVLSADDRLTQARSRFFVQMQRSYRPLATPHD